MTPAFTVTITADSPEQLHSSLRALLPDESGGVGFGFVAIAPFQDLLLAVGQRVEEEGYEMEVWKKGERETKPASTGTDRKKEEARAKLRGELVASLAEATHATAPVKEEIEEAFDGEVKAEAVDPVEELPKPPKKARAAKTGNGKAETADQIKARTIIKLQELYSAGKKAEVNKLLAQFGEGSKTFSSIPADQFVAIAEAAEAI
jgi:hypothetical protein